MTELRDQETIQGQPEVGKRSETGRGRGAVDVRIKENPERVGEDPEAGREKGREARTEEEREVKIENPLLTQKPWRAGANSSRLKKLFWTRCLRLSLLS